VALKTRLAVTSDDLRCQREGGSPDIERNYRILIQLMSPPERAMEYHLGVSLDVMGQSTDQEVQDYFTTLHAIWPLWLHYLAPDHSPEFLVRALFADPETGDISSADIQQFIEYSTEELANFYRDYSIPLDARQTERAALHYFRQRGLIHDDA
jgi:hypothetical protein